MSGLRTFLGPESEYNNHGCHGDQGDTETDKKMEGPIVIKLGELRGYQRTGECADAVEGVHYAQFSGRIRWQSCYKAIRVSLGERYSEPVDDVCDGHDSERWFCCLDTIRDDLDCGAQGNRL